MFQMGAAPVLEEAMKFAEDRHRLILSNVANADTPGYRRQDLDRAGFNRVLSEAIQERDLEHRGAFFLRSTVRDPNPRSHGGFSPSRTPFPETDGVLRHDQNNVSMEREMALMAKNAGQYTTYANLLNKAYGQIRAAITEQPGAGA